MDDVEEAAGEVRFVTVRQMSAMAQVHGEHFVARLEHGEIDGHVGAAAGMRLHVGVFRVEQPARAIDGELFDHVHIFTTAVPAFLRITFGVLIGQDRSLRFHDRGAGEIFAGDQLDVLLLPRAFVFDGLGDVGIDRFQAQVAAQKLCFHFANAAFVSAAGFEAGAEKGVHDFSGEVG